MRLFLALSVLMMASSLAAAESPERRGEKWIVHEWGTFTVLLDEKGRHIGGINIDDETLPGFVHRLGRGILDQPTEIPPVMQKGVTPCHPDVVMRLETPVVYFYPPKRQALPVRLDLSVAFRGGWLSEFYPRAEWDAPGVTQDEHGNVQFGKLTPGTLGRLSWHNLTIGGAGALPETSSRVWKAPRAVTAATVTASGGETEKYLFYRGVSAAPPVVTVTTASAWNLKVERDGQVAASRAGKGLPLRDLAALRQSMRDALQSAGLFEEEAEAMLSTWDHAYFRTPGTRTFVLMDRSEVDRMLPLTMSVEADVQRVFVARLEFITAEHRRLLSAIAAATPSQPDWLQKAVRENPAIYLHVTEGRATLRDVVPEVPTDYQAYLDLGRFRKAILLDAAKTDPKLAAFAATYGIRYAEPLER